MFLFTLFLRDIHQFRAKGLYRHHPHQHLKGTAFKILNQTLEDLRDKRTTKIHIEGNPVLLDEVREALEQNTKPRSEIPNFALFKIPRSVKCYTKRPEINSTKLQKVTVKYGDSKENPKNLVITKVETNQGSFFIPTRRHHSPETLIHRFQEGKLKYIPYYK